MGGYNAYEILHQAKFPVVIVIGGVDGAGKGETVNALLEWMDPRHIAAHAFGPPTDEEAARPGMWRFWRALPAKGLLGIFFGSWYTAPIVERVRREIGQAGPAPGTNIVVRRMWPTRGPHIKFWFNLSKKRPKKRWKAGAAATACA